MIMTHVRIPAFRGYIRSLAQPEVCEFDEPIYGSAIEDRRHFSSLLSIVPSDAYVFPIGRFRVLVEAIQYVDKLRAEHFL